MLGAAAFVAALTPSMIPRPGVLQGVEAGIAFALLYGVGTGARALWSWLELPVAGDRYPRAFLRMSIPLCVALVGYGLVRETDWQNAIRRAMGMPAVTAGLLVLIAIVSAPVALFLIRPHQALQRFGDAHFGSFGKARPSPHRASRRFGHRGGAVLGDRQRALAEDGSSQAR